MCRRLAASLRCASPSFEADHICGSGMDSVLPLSSVNMLNFTLPLHETTPSFAANAMTALTSLAAFVQSVVALAEGSSSFLFKCFVYAHFVSKYGKYIGLVLGLCSSLLALKLVSVSVRNSFRVTQLTSSPGLPVPHISPRGHLQHRQPHSRRQQRRHGEGYPRRREQGSGL